MGRLANKYALITGATGCIGLETARQFVAEGATVAITGRNQAALQAAGQVLGDGVILLRSDAGQLDDQRELARQLSVHWPRLDVVYVNAGDVTHRPLADWDEGTYDRLMATNLKGPFFLLQALLPLLANPSSVILCGSVSAWWARSCAWMAASAICDRISVDGSAPRVRRSHARGSVRCACRVPIEPCARHSSR